MSTKMHNGGHERDGAPFHESVTFEPRDINVATIVKQLIYLAITIVVSLAICIPVLKVLTSAASEKDTPMATNESSASARSTLKRLKLLRFIPLYTARKSSSGSSPKSSARRSR